MKPDPSSSTPAGRCPPAEDIVASVVEGDAPQDAVGTVQAHMARCAACRRLAADARETLEALHRWPDAPANRDLVSGVLARIPDAARKKRPPREMRPGWHALCIVNRPR